MVLFLTWLKFFIEQTKPSKDKPILLIVDNHESHRSLQVLDYATEKSVILLSVPPHTTHKLQPLDRCVYGPLSTYFENEVDNFQKLYPSRRIQMYDMGRLFTAAYTKACTISNAASAFKNVVSGHLIGISLQLMISFLLL